MPSKPEVSPEVLEEGSYHLSRLGLTTEAIAKHFETTPANISRLIESYSAKLASGQVSSDDFDRVFWEDVKKEAEGDVKLTFVSEKGFHHSWKSELSRLDGSTLMAIFESSKDFLSTDPNQRFLDVPPPQGFDPLALEREVRRAVAVISELIEEKWAEGHR
jgi:hypothetical protein